MGHIALQDYLRQIEGLLDENRLEEAAAHCFSILQQQPLHVATYRLFGRVLLEQQKHSDVIDIFQRVLSADPEDLIAHAGLAEAYRGMGDLPRAVWYMERASEIQPYNRAVQIELRTLYEERDGFAPEQVSLTRAALARLYVRGGNYRLAADELRELLADQSDRVELRVLLAEALYWDDRRVEAAWVCANIMDELSDSIKANAILAEVWSSGGRESEARPFIERLWGLTLLDRYERDNETLIGRALSHGKFADLPEQVLVERLDFVPADIEESVESIEPRPVLAAVAVKELPGWLDEIDDEPAPLSGSDAGRSILEEDETDWSNQFVTEREIEESLESAAEDEAAEMERIGIDPQETHLGVAMEESTDQETAEDRELSGPGESIEAETTLLLESEADGDLELQLEERLSGELVNETAADDEPIEPAETLVGEYKVAQEEMPAGEPEQPINAFFLEEALAEDSEEEVVQQTTADPVVDNGLPRDAAPVEPEHSPEDLFLESIVAEAFGELGPTEAPEIELAELAEDEEGASAFGPVDPQDDISDDVSLEEIAAEAFEQEIATEPGGDLAPESRLAPPETAAPGQERYPDDPTLEGLAAGAAEEERPRPPDDEARGDTDLLFAALAAHEIKSELQEQGEERAELDENEGSVRPSQADASGQEIERSPEPIDVEPAEPLLEDHIFESLAADVEGEDAIGWPPTESESDEDVGEYPDLPTKVTEEFDDLPEEISPVDSEARPAALLGALAADVTDEGASHEPAEATEEFDELGEEILPVDGEARPAALYGALAADVTDEGAFHEPAGEPVDRGIAAAFDQDAEDEVWPEGGGVEAAWPDLADEVVSLEPSDIVTKEFDGPPDFSIDPAEPLPDEAAPLPQSTTTTPPESPRKEAIFDEFSPAQGETPIESTQGDMVLDSPEIESPTPLSSDDLFDAGQTLDGADSSDWLDDLSEDTNDVENLPDWLYDAIGFTGELESPDDYEDPDWLGELGGDGEESVRESQPVARVDSTQLRNDDAQNSAHGETEKANFGRARSTNEEEIPDWLQDPGASLEELPPDLVENLGISGIDAGDDDEGALSWLEELAAEPPSTEKGKGLNESGGFDDSAKRRPNRSDEPADSD